MKEIENFIRYVNRQAPYKELEVICNECFEGDYGEMSVHYLRANVDNGCRFTSKVNLGQLELISTPEYSQMSVAQFLLAALRCGNNRIFRGQLERLEGRLIAFPQDYFPQDDDLCWSVHLQGGYAPRLIALRLSSEAASLRWRAIAHLSSEKYICEDTRGDYKGYHRIIPEITT